MINQDLKESTYYRTQGSIQIIDDILGFPGLLETAKLRNEGEGNG
jgi:hypothetical protein